MSGFLSRGRFELRWLYYLLLAVACQAWVPTTSSLPIGRFADVARLNRQNMMAQKNQLFPFGIRSERHSLFALFAASDDSPGFMSRKNFLIGLGAVVIGLVPLVELYSRAGNKDFPAELFPPPQSGSWTEVEHATLVFHGAAGQDQYTDALMQRLQDPKGSVYNSIIEWSQFSSNIFQASFNGQQLGRDVAARLLQKAPNLKSIHFIGISVGAFAADAATTKVKSKGGDAPYVQLTLLDPFTQRGIFDFGYGQRTFGKSADYVEQYLNTDDPVPSTNAPLSNAVCYDITSIRPDDIFGHDWPVAYYSRSKKVGITKSQDRGERGTVINVTE